MDLLLYFIKVSMYAAIMLGIYYVVWRNSSLYRFSRIYVLLSMVLPLVLPFIHIVSAEQSPIPMQAVSLPIVSVSSAPTENTTTSILLDDVFLLCYLAVSISIGLVYIAAYSRLYHKLSKASRVSTSGYNILTNTGIGPGSLGKMIFFPSQHVDDIIVQHELAHIKCLHRYDSLLLQMMHVCCWISPAHWMLGRELKMVHEFEADHIASNNVDTSDYVLVLLSHALGRMQPLHITHSFFHHPLKRRVMMLQKTIVSSKGRLLTAATVLTAVFTCGVLLLQVKESTATSFASRTDTTTETADAKPYKQTIAVQDGEVRLLPAGGIAFVSVRDMPRFKGDLTEWMQNNLRYPEAARGSNMNGMCTVQFTVDANGFITDPHVLQSSQHAVLDAEALRVIRNMPQWQPGYHKGSAVPVLFSQTIVFGKDGKVQMHGGC
ncbi:MAG: TonB family protein [Sphingobacteriales bacterium]|nr:MAG: TonB family protein [Sphingobacteriales bacterium]